MRSALPHSARLGSRVPLAALRDLFANDLFIEVRTQDLRHHHAAVLLLVILDDRDPRAPNCRAAAVQCVRVVGLLAAAETDAGATRLMGLEVRAGADLLVAILARQPDLDIVRL